MLLNRPDHRTRHSWRAMSVHEHLNALSVSQQGKPVRIWFAVIAARSVLCRKLAKMLTGPVGATECSNPSNRPMLLPGPWLRVTLLLFNTSTAKSAQRLQTSLST
jgi:hypothetical protein